MKAIFINADKETVEDITINFAGQCGLDEFYAKIGNGCRMVQAVYLTNTEVLVVDEEALLRDIKIGFIMNGSHFLGNGIIVGAGVEDWDDTALLAAQIRKKVEFFTVQEEDEDDA